MRKLTNWLSTYMEYTSNLEAPDSFHWWTGVWTIAAALRQKVYFDQEHYRWTPNFYIIFVAPPAIATKSTTANQGKRLLQAIPGIHFGPNAITWQGLVTFLEGCTEGILMPDGLYYNHSCLSFCASELGTLINFQDRDMLAFLTDVWDDRSSDVWSKMTKGSGNNDIESPWLNIIACTTPDWIADSMPQHVIGGGFTSRCIFVHEATKRRLVAYPRDMSDKSVWKLRDVLSHDLEIISQLRGEFTLSKAAYAFGVEWYAQHWKQFEGRLGDKEFLGYMGRKQCHAHKLAMVLSAAESDSLVIELKHLDHAVTFVSALEPELPKVFHAIHTNADSDRTVRLMNLCRKHKKIAKTALWRQVITQFAKLSEFDEALAGLVNAGYVTLAQHGNVFLVEATETLLGTLDKAEDTPAARVIPIHEAGGS